MHFAKPLPVGNDGGMELTYPAAAEKFRGEIRAWLKENLPAGWFDAGFEMSPDERKKIQELRLKISEATKSSQHGGINSPRHISSPRLLDKQYDYTGVALSSSRKMSHAQRNHIPAASSTHDFGVNYCD